MERKSCKRKTGQPVLRTLRKTALLNPPGFAAPLWQRGIGWVTALTLSLGLLLSAPNAAAQQQGKILYYRNPMGLPDTSPVPKQDSMGMDYIPVYESEDLGSDQVSISPAKIQKLGVRTEAAQRRIFNRPVRAVGLIAPDERRLFVVAPRFEGWIERLLVNTTGQTVKRGEPLLMAYSPDVLSAQDEYRVARDNARTLSRTNPEQGERMRLLAETALSRLRNWEVSAEQLDRLRSDSQPLEQVTLKAPADGVVLEKVAIQGMRFMPGEKLYRIADLSALWLLADVFEQDVRRVQPGQTARITVNAFPGEEFSGKVTFIYPTLNPQTRTAQVRIELPNPQGRLRPAMYATVEIAAGQNEAALTVPSSAVLNSGLRQVVLVERGEGRYQPRPVKLGAYGDEWVQVLEGLAENERVVVSANFLIDAESNLKAALSGFGDPPSSPAPLPPAGEGSIPLLEKGGAGGDCPSPSSRESLTCWNA
ncbi:MAG: efflux RND transporter periplasmic adaptor subunit [Synechococcaceae cyanobacterium SM1_2_3]|nr:efflux RND transporter periplasmic adaptor subunit [Synechococcaceae cyanobacterium SM1_2_3]